MTITYGSEVVKVDTFQSRPRKNWLVNNYVFLIRPSLVKTSKLIYSLLTSPTLDKNSTCFWNTSLSGVSSARARRAHAPHEALPSVDARNMTFQEYMEHLYSVPIGEAVFSGCVDDNRYGVELVTLYHTGVASYLIIGQRSSNPPGRINELFTTLMDECLAIPEI